MKVEVDALLITVAIRDRPAQQTGAIMHQNFVEQAR
jgi:hypothetical protein